MRKTIGVLDGSKTFSMYIFVILRRMGFDVGLFNSMKEVANNKMPIDMFLIGDNIPGQTMQQAVETLQDMHGEDIPIAIVSTMPDGVDELIQRKHGIVGVISKPVQPRELNTLLAENLTFLNGKRVNLRMSAAMPAVYSAENSYLDTRVVSLSNSGALIGTDKPLKTGTKVLLELTMHNYSMKILCSAVYNRTSFKGDHHGTAILFHGLTDDEKGKIDDFIQRDLIKTAEMSIPATPRPVKPPSQSLPTQTQCASV